jgi:hypothetical protein
MDELCEMKVKGPWRGWGDSDKLVIPEPICCDVGEHIERGFSLLPCRVTLNVRQPTPASVMNLDTAYST